MSGCDPSRCKNCKCKSIYSLDAVQFKMRDFSRLEKKFGALIEYRDGNFKRYDWNKDGPEALVSIYC